MTCLRWLMQEGTQALFWFEQEKTLHLAGKETCIILHLSARSRGYKQVERVSES
jgi:hypothetical protein